MDTKSLIELQKKGILLHRLVYIIFFLSRVLMQILDKSIQSENTIFILVFLVLCAVLEEVFYHFGYFDRIFILRCTRYIQCVLASGMLCFIQGNGYSGISVIALVIMFLIDFFLTMGVMDKENLITYMISVGIPILVILISKISVSTSNQWLFLLFDIVILFLVLFFEALAFVNYMDNIDSMIFNQRHELESIAEQNENILQMQEKLKNTNDELTLQKIDLQNANRQIKMANQEMVAQAEILHYIAMSFDVSKISNQITDAIMQVKKLGFCAVYIRENVYLNKHANYVIRTDIGLLQSKIRENIAGLYVDMTAREEKESVFHESIKEIFPFLKEVNINSVYIKVLGLDNDTYGLFMIGDSRNNLFADNMSFYDAIIAQYDIAISNAKIYNEMQQMARKDGLTGINNRIYFTQLFKETVAQVQAENGCMSVALFDIDKFKSVNDTYGHLAGDEVIKRIASVTEACIEQYDGFICRYGGEEFVVVLPGKKLEIAQPIIEELFEELCRQVVQYNEYEIHMSVSVGLTTYPEVCADPEDLLKRADWCMYYAKEHGRHQINVDDGSIHRE
jgi:diguanylate cyclase (GGDEF)-like protein